MSLTVLLAVAFVGAALYYVCPLRLRWVLLLLLSYGFYLTCGLSALPFIALTTLTTWAARWSSPASAKAERPTCASTRPS